MGQTRNEARRRPVEMSTYPSESDTSAPAGRDAQANWSVCMAVGGGLEIAISCDPILAADHARFALPEINVGVLADAASIKLHRRIPFHVAMDLLLTGRWMEADEAARWGLVNEVVPAARLMDAPARSRTFSRQGRRWYSPRSRRPSA